MNQQELQSLFYSFVEYREKDDVDGIILAQQRETADADSICQSGSIEGIIGLGIIPSPPVQHISHAPLNAAQTAAVANAGSTLALLVEEWKSKSDENNIKFETHHLLVARKEQTISVCIERSRELNQVTKVTWETCNITAQSGIHYVGSTGEIMFHEGETKKSIQIKILKFEDEAMDLRFKVKLNDIIGINNPQLLTIALRRINNDENCVLNNLPPAPFSVDAIRFALEGSFSARTFHLALSHLCSTEDSVQLQLALAFELGRLCYRELKFRPELFFNILTDFFRMDKIGF